MLQPLETLPADRDDEEIRAEMRELAHGCSALPTCGLLLLG
jgi:hypothetical protein